MLSIAFTEGFRDQLTRFPNTEQKLIKQKVMSFAMEPSSSGFNAEKLGSGWWSGRVSDDIRFIWYPVNGGAVVCWVDHHDAAYAWANRHKHAVHPRTGVPQLYVTPEDWLVKRPPSENVENPVSSPESIEEVGSASLHDVLPFAAEDREYLLTLGVPADWLDRLRDVGKSQVDTLIGVLPDETVERLIDLADGKRPQPSLKTQIDMLADPYEHPDAKRRFLLVRTDAELERALAGAWENWMVFLHPAQRAAVETRHRGPSKVTGAAGTGKSVVAIHRSLHLARKTSNGRVLLTTFSKTLAARLGQQLDRLLASDTVTRTRIDVVNLHKWAYDAWRSIYGSLQVANNTQIQTILADIAKRQNLTGFAADFLRAEWQDVVARWGLKTIEEYRRIERRGRGQALASTVRERLWPVFAELEAELQRRRWVTWDTLCENLSRHFADRVRPYAHVVVDEAQDFGPCDLHLVRALVAAGDDDLTLCGDLGQRIYKRPFAWTAAGIDVRGRAQRLKVNYRTTSQIRAVADRLIGSHPVDPDGGDEPRDAISIRHGPRPRFSGFPSRPEEVTAVATWINRCNQDGIAPGQIAICARSKSLIDTVAKRAVERAGLTWIELTEEAGGAPDRVALTTMHRAKGLEFKAVAVIGCSVENLPQPLALREASDEDEIREIMEQERQLLYVACTRARDFLLVTWVGQPSPFLPQRGA